MRSQKEIIIDVLGQSCGQHARSCGLGMFWIISGMNQKK